MKVTYQISLTRIFSILINPVLIAAILLFVFSIGKNVNMMLPFVFCMAILLPYICIIISYWRHAQGVVLKCENKRITIRYPNETFSFTRDEIKKVTEYHGYILARVTRDFKYWCIVTEERNYIITFLTVSPLNFERLFWNKIEQKSVLWPSIKKMPC